MDFYKIKERSLKNGVLEIYPDFKVCRSKDLMVRGRAFYAVWDEEAGLWSTDEYDVQRLIDNDLTAYRKKVATHDAVQVQYMSDFSSKSWINYRQYISHVSDHYHQLDETLTFSNTEVQKDDYVSKRLPYPLQSGKFDAFSEIINTLYDPDERDKLEWAIGSIVSGDSRFIQKFVVLYGQAGTGKSTILNIVQALFREYTTTFDAKALTSSSNAFSTEVFGRNPLVAIQHDGDLSRIEDNTKLNSIVSHEDMVMNEKYKASYSSKLNCFLFMGTNKPVKITDSKSGVIRRLIDVHPSGRKLPQDQYQRLMSQIKFELGAIASHCLEVYEKLGPHYYDSYKPLDMMYQTDVFFNYVENYFEEFKENDGISLKRAYDLYKQYCDDSIVEFKIPKYKFREELKSYFKEFIDRGRIDGQQVRNYYSGFLADKFTSSKDEITGQKQTMDMSCTKSILDEDLKDCVAQYATANETPFKKWEEIETKLSQIDTSKLHYLKPPPNHIVIDFDLKDDGKKSLEKNLEEASKWPITYAELSKSGKGVHLHYIYDGNPEDLAQIFSEGIEVKVFLGNSSLRRKLTKCNNSPISHINSGLPLKEKKKMINFEAVQTEKSIRNGIEINLNKQVHADTRSSIDFIGKILNDAYSSGIKYDVTDMRTRVFLLASNSTNQSEYCIKAVQKMPFKSDDPSPPVYSPESDDIVFFDCEVFPNLFVVCWKIRGHGRSVVRMINPTSSDIENVLKLKLVGFNCRKYDNHILYAAYLGYKNDELFKLSQSIIDKNSDRFFGEAYNISYTDVYDFSSKKQSLKKWEIELGIHHRELGFRWDQPVPEELWEQVADYCSYDVIATEAVFDARQSDFTARLILAELSGLTPNDTTNSHSKRIIFGDNRKPQSEFNYPDLSKEFPGYKFENGVSTYRGEETGEGGYVYAEPGMYVNVALLDIESMHPTTIEILDLFGPYTKVFSELKLARVYIKHGKLDEASKLFGGKLAKFLCDPDVASSLAYALKIVINSIYGLTSAKFPNEFRDPRNVDNVVAKRGALFMINLKHELQDRGFTVCHIKTDSVKIPNASKDVIDFVVDYGKKYGYKFEHEATYDRMCLVNDAVYIAKDVDWTATGAQFAHPYVFKTLFSHEDLEFSDLCETKSVSTAMYLDFNKDGESDPEKRQFVGKVGRFCPVDNDIGGSLVREKKENGEIKYGNVTGTKGRKWLESEYVSNNLLEDKIDKSYFASLAEAAIQSISKYGDFEWFVSEDVLPFL